jgi:hypothetical protein
MIAHPHTARRRVTSSIASGFRRYVELMAKTDPYGVGYYGLI